MLAITLMVIPLLAIEWVRNAPEHPMDLKVMNSAGNVVNQVVIRLPICGGHRMISPRC